MSKGSTPRPIPDREGYEANWDRVFGSKERDAKDGANFVEADNDQREPDK